MKNKSIHMKQILNEWNKFKHKNSLNEICLTKNETKLLIQLIENKNNLNESILDSLKKFPEFLKKFNTLKDKLNRAGLEKIVSFLKSKIKKITNVKILFLASSIALVVYFGNDNNYVEINAGTMNNVNITAEETANAEGNETFKKIDCGNNKLCIISVGPNGEISDVKASDLNQYKLDIEKPRDEILNVSQKDETLFTITDLYREFEEFAKEKQIDSGILFYQPDIEQQLKKEIEKNISQISDKNETKIFNNIINNNEKQYHLISIYITEKENTSYRDSIEKLFQLYEQQLLENNIDYDKSILSALKSNYLNKDIREGLGGFTTRFKFEKDNVIFPAPQVAFMTDFFDIGVTIRHEFMHSISDFEGLSDFYVKLSNEMSDTIDQRHFTLKTYYNAALNILRAQYNTRYSKDTLERGYKKEDIVKYKDSLNTALKYFIGLGLIKKNTDESGDYIFSFVAENSQHNKLYYGKPNENARHMFDLQKVISDNTTQETFNITKHIFKNMFHGHVDDMLFAKKLLESYIKNIDKLGPMINSENEFNKKYLKGSDFYNNDINEDFNDHRIKFLLYLNKLSKKEAESVKIAVHKIEKELKVNIDHMNDQRYKDDKDDYYINYKESLAKLLTKAFGLAQLYNNSIK